MVLVKNATLHEVLKNSQGHKKSKVEISPIVEIPVVLLKHTTPKNFLQAKSDYFYSFAHRIISPLPRQVCEKFPDSLSHKNLTFFIGLQRMGTNGEDLIIWV